MGMRDGNGEDCPVGVVRSGVRLDRDGKRDNEMESRGATVATQRISRCASRLTLRRRDEVDWAPVGDGVGMRNACSRTGSRR